jgi:chromosomal replication initiation ATPase DnaA
MNQLSMWKAPFASHATMAEIAESIAQAHDVTVEDIRGRSHVKHISRARQAFMAAAYGTGRWSSQAIGEWLDGRKHSTVLHGVGEHRGRVA